MYLSIVSQLAVITYYSSHGKRCPTRPRSLHVPLPSSAARRPSDRPPTMSTDEMREKADEGGSDPDGAGDRADELLPEVLVTEAVTDDEADDTVDVELPELEAVITPCLLLDRDKLMRNIDAMAERAKILGVQLRPHMKTHKCL